jgi:adenylate cyclase
MAAINNEELVKRIAKLSRENKDLEGQIKKLEDACDRLKTENEKIKALYLKFPGEPAETKGKAQKFNMVTLLFADMHGFNKVMTNVDSVTVMDELDEILYEFEAIAGRHKIERIKTIGDTLLWAGGIPVKNITNPVDVVLAAFEMRSFLQKFELRKRGGEKRIWDMKTGIHTGPVTAELAGKKKISYDLKGDTVHNVSRIGAVSDDGTILISVMTSELVKEFFDCEYFGRIPVKYKGDLQVFRVVRIKPELSVDRKGISPGKEFNTKLSLIRFNDIQELVLDKLEKELPEYLFYHNVKHTVDVVTEVELIGWAEGCNDEEILLLKTAALFHDVGHTVSYEDHEEQGARYAGEILPAFGYTPEQIITICSLIMSTKLPPRPANLLEEIICDSDLDYLGRSDFIPVSNTLFNELRARKKMTDINEWNKLQIKFISGHQYFTKTARSLREVNKQLQIERIQSLIKD